MSTTQSTQSETRIVNGRVFRVTRIATACDTDARYTQRDHVALLHAGRRVDRDAWLDERTPFDSGVAWDDDTICICDAYAPHKRPGKCPIHAT